MQWQIICQSRFNQQKCQPSRKRNAPIYWRLSGKRSSFFEVVKKAPDTIKPVGKPTLPRKQKNPDFSILQYVTGYEEPENNAYHLATAHNYFKPMYFQALYAVFSAINDQFEQAALTKFRNIEDLLLKPISKADSSKELKFLAANFCGDFDYNQLDSELHLIPTMFKQSAPVGFREICKTFQEMDEEKRPMIKNIWNIIRVVLTSGATSATLEQSFSMQSRIKTWLRSTMGQKRYKSLSVLNAHTNIVDNLSLIEVAERFANAKERRRNEFGTFTEKDLH